MSSEQTSVFHKMKDGLFSGLFGGNGNVSVGVDVGSASIKVVVLERAGEAIHLKNYAIATSKQEIIKPGTSGVISESASELIRKTIKEAEVSKKSVQAAVPSFSSLITAIEIPRAAEKDIDEIIQNEAPKYIPVQLADVVYGWQLIDEGSKDDEEEKEDAIPGVQRDGKIHILLVAIMREISAKYEAVFSKAGLKIEALEIDAFSLTRALVGSNTSPHLILDIGHKVCNIVAVSNGNVLLNRTIDIAGDRITKTIARSLNIDTQRAEQIKHKNGMNAGEAQGGTEMIGQIMDAVVAEIKKTNKAIKKTYVGIEISEIVLTGGGSKLVGMVDYLSKELGLKTRIGEPFAAINYPESIQSVIDEHGSELVIAVGLALNAFEDKK
ncbi:type IV pilus assembly protein PilM [bacterium]|jgi:type IV pilus assembly protein PilM|nr:type IV pilus assembly protein PilM [bacterium]MBT4250733.1 type IV pilus assembly protein PilM [bacterium]MBT4598184.1 type IV pilus assembly protein PilM [bacterium]MBT6753782.1 type IV pilus assembly protein PilM [bacterium]MBT7037505.1 type IV pilus assembly protein PilM [bacterium]